MCHMWATGQVFTYDYKYRVIQCNTIVFTAFTKSHLNVEAVGACIYTLCLLYSTPLHLGRYCPYLDMTDRLPYIVFLCWTCIMWLSYDIVYIP